MLLLRVFKFWLFFFVGLSAAHASRPVYVGPEIISMAINPKNTKIMYVGTFGEGVYKSTNGGKSWVHCSKQSKMEKVSALAIDPLHPNTIYAGESSFEDKAIFKSTDAGRSWRSMNRGILLESHYGELYIPAIPLIAINPKEPNKILAVALKNSSLEEDHDGIFMSEDAGHNWHKTYSGDAIFSLAFDPKQPNNVFATDYHNLLKSFDGGQTWQASRFPSYLGKSLRLVRLQVFNDKKQILYAHGSGLMKSEDAGETWEKVKGACGNFSVASSAPNVLYMNCNINSNSSIDKSSFAKSSDFGESWESLGEGLPRAWRAVVIMVDPNNPDVVFASWQAGGLYRSTNGGKIWQRSDKGLLDKSIPRRMRSVTPKPLKE